MKENGFVKKLFSLVFVMKGLIDTKQNAVKAQRNYGIDLLRCFAMAMVVMLHILSRSGLLKIPAGSLKYEVCWFIEIFCYCAVDCFVIISGYVGLNNKFKLSRIINLWMQVVFYSILCTVIMGLINGDLAINTVLKCFVPVSAKAYWFFTQYFILCFFMPLINGFIKNSTVKKNAFFAAVFLAIFSLTPMIRNFYGALTKTKINDFFLTNRGYSAIWLIVVYFIGALIKKMDEENILDKIKTAYFVFAVAVSDVIIWLVHYWCVSRDEVISHEFIVSYTSIFVVISAISLVVIFSRLKFNNTVNKIIAFFSAGAFSVYIIHEQILIRPVFAKCVSPLLDMRLIKLLPLLLVTVAIVFIICVTIDFIRSKLFKITGINKLCKRADNLVVQLEK